jgi:hypothetical protein
VDKQRKVTRAAGAKAFAVLQVGKRKALDDQPLAVVKRILLDQPFGC